MKTKINQHAYPFTGQVKGLPLYLAGIGGTEYQGAVVRSEGYCWNQILICAQGSGVLRYDGNSIEISENSVVFLPADYPHEYEPYDEKWDVRWVVFDGFACGEIFKELGMDRPIAVSDADCREMKKLYDKMFVALKSDKVFGSYTCSGLVYQYLLEFHRIASGCAKRNKADSSDILMPVLNYIEENFRVDFPITVLSEISGVSHQYLCRIFRQTMNIRPNEYITIRRLQEAKHLLEETSEPVSEICVKSGFNDAGYFSTVFKRHEGITPAEYRRRMRGGK